MSVRVHIPTPLRQHTQGHAVIEAEGTTVQGLLDDLSQKFPAIKQRLFDNGQVRRFVNVYLNDEDIRYLENLSTAVKAGNLELVAAREMALPIYSRAELLAALLCRLRLRGLARALLEQLVVLRHQPFTVQSCNRVVLQPGCEVARLAISRSLVRARGGEITSRQASRRRRGTESRHWIETT